MGEFELLGRLRRRLPPPSPRLRDGMGDDAAITVPGGATATSVDALVEGVHFRRDQASLAQIGRKGLAVALSDLAAMGAEPGEAYVVLGVPPDLDEDGCIELLDGLLEVAIATDTTLAGGDITRTEELMLAVTVVGHAPGERSFVTRFGAHPGDALAVTGELGGAAAGLLLLERPELADAVPDGTAARLRARQLEPRPRLAAGRALAKTGATGMIDISDGLGGDSLHLADYSGVKLSIDAGALPIADGVAEVAAAAGLDPLRLATSSGEDYELLVTLPPDRLTQAAAIVAAEGVALTEIGEAGSYRGVEIRLPDGRLLEPEGFDQLG